MTEHRTDLTVRDLRRRWKPTKERLKRTGFSHPLSVRLHRAFSWIAAVEEKDFERDQDQMLLFLWIALNSLYGKWDGETQFPVSDKKGIGDFISLISENDQDEVIKTCIQENEALVLEVIGDPFLNKRYWKSLSGETQFNPQTAVQKAKNWLGQQETRELLKALLDRIYFNRCQLFHGASTFQSGLNRDSVGRSACMLHKLLQASLIVIIDHCLNENWGELCYPPTEDSEGKNLSALQTKYPR